jgi:hypothetical protein
MHVALHATEDLSRQFGLTSGIVANVLRTIDRYDWATPQYDTGWKISSKCATIQFFLEGHFSSRQQWLKN